MTPRPWKRRVTTGQNHAETGQRENFFTTQKIRMYSAVNIMSHYESKPSAFSNGGSSFLPDGGPLGKGRGRRDGMKRSQSKLTYGKKYPSSMTSVLYIGTVLKKRKRQIEAFRYERKPNGHIVKVAA